MLTSLCVDIPAPTSETKYILMTSLYNETHIARIKEYVTCLEHNLLHPLIEECCIIYDMSKDNLSKKLPILSFIKRKKLTVVRSNQRPTFGDFFELANKNYMNKRIIICNADIFFNSTLALLQNINFDNKFLALTRWDVKPDNSLELFYYRANTDRIPAIDSQDAWIFTTPIKRIENTKKIGTMGCDNRLAYQVAIKGYEVLNPCLSIQCCHLHLSAIRNYDPSPISNDPFLAVYWTSVADISSF